MPDAVLDKRFAHYLEDFADDEGFLQATHQAGLQVKKKKALKTAKEAMRAGPDPAKKEEGGRSKRRPDRQTAEGSRRGRNDHGPTTMGRLRGLGFLRGSLTAPERTPRQKCGAAKRKTTAPGNDTPDNKRRRGNNRPVITMLLHCHETSHPVRVLLDTGCSIGLINQQTVKRLRLAKRPHKNPRTIENFTGETVKNAGQHQTEPLRLQHQKHFSTEKFEISPTEKDVDIFLPFSWIERHPPQGAWTQDEIRFNSVTCLETCTKYETDNFSLSWDDSVLMDGNTRVIGHVSTATNETPWMPCHWNFSNIWALWGRRPPTNSRNIGHTTAKST